MTTLQRSLFKMNPMTKFPRVLIVGNFLSEATGIRFVCEDLAERLAGADWSVITTSPRGGRILRLIDMIATIYRRKREYDLAVVDVYSGLSFVWAEVACKALQSLGRSFVLTLHGGNLPAFARRWPRRVRSLLNSASMVTTPSRYLFHELKNLRPDLKIISNPLDINTYQYRGRQKPQPRMIWLRAFRYIYNPQLAPRTLALLVPDFPKIHLAMIGPDRGDGTYLETQEVAKELNVSDSINFVGGVPKGEVPYWMSEGDIFLNTTNFDNMPISVLEAMASGLCVVSTNVGGITYLLEDEKDALLVPPDDPTAMAAAVRRILTEPGLAARLSQNARRKAEQFDWSVILPQWEALFHNICKEAT